jgi:ribulose-phosphate 3-epimerase
MNVRLAPSILAADFGRLADEVARVEAAGAELIHVDVMDGHFVPNISLGVPVVAALSRATRLPLDVHLMIETPDRYLRAFADAGASGLTVHVEACDRLEHTLAAIRAVGCRVGAAVSPGTPVDALAPVARDLDLLLIMSVYPGYTGQAFLPQSLPKVAAARALLARVGSLADIEVDGGVGVGNAGRLVAAGATILVAGASVFHTADTVAALAALRSAAATP